MYKLYFTIIILIILLYLLNNNNYIKTNNIYTKNNIEHFDATTADAAAEEEDAEIAIDKIKKILDETYPSGGSTLQTYTSLLGSDITVFYAAADDKFNYRNDIIILKDEYETERLAYQDAATADKEAKKTDYKTKLIDIFSTIDNINDVIKKIKTILDEHYGSADTSTQLLASDLSSNFYSGVIASFDYRTDIINGKNNYNKEKIAYENAEKSVAYDPSRNPETAKSFDKVFRATKKTYTDKLIEEITKYTNINNTIIKINTILADLARTVAIKLFGSELIHFFPSTNFTLTPEVDYKQKIINKKDLFESEKTKYDKAVTAAAAATTDKKKTYADLVKTKLAYKNKLDDVSKYILGQIESNDVRVFFSNGDITLYYYTEIDTSSSHKLKYMHVYSYKKEDQKINVFSSDEDLKDTPPEFLERYKSSIIPANNNEFRDIDSQDKDANYDKPIYYNQRKNIIEQREKQYHNNKEKIKIYLNGTTIKAYAENIQINKTIYPILEFTMVDYDDARTGDNEFAIDNHLIATTNIINRFFNQSIPYEENIKKFYDDKDKIYLYSTFDEQKKTTGNVGNVDFMTKQSVYYRLFDLISAEDFLKLLKSSSIGDILKEDVNNLKEYNSLDKEYKKIMGQKEIKLKEHEQSKLYKRGIDILKKRIDKNKRTIRTIKDISIGVHIFLYLVILVLIVYKLQ